MWLMVWIVNSMRHPQWHLANVPTSLYCYKLWLTADCPLKLISWKLMPIVRQLFRKIFRQMLACLIADLFFCFYIPIVRNIWHPLLLTCDIRSRKILKRQLFQCTCRAMILCFSQEWQSRTLDGSSANPEGRSLYCYSAHYICLSI